jgi:hypothetical protein
MGPLTLENALRLLFVYAEKEPIKFDGEEVLGVTKALEGMIEWEHPRPSRAVLESERPTLLSAGGRGK